MNNETILVISNQIVYQSSKVNYPDLNYPNSNLTVLRYLHQVDYENLKIQLDDENGPWFDSTNFPSNVGFYNKITKTKSKK